MCGIYGGHPELLMERTEQLLLHRGPDQQGAASFVDRRGNDFVLGMTRLSIVDRREMAVPFTARGATIVFNGEIYNWREIRQKLEARGLRFETETDTEVALHAYLEWGVNCLDRFNGMFAIAIWRNGELFLARDRLGKKPLFYTSRGQRFAFGSEIKVFAELEYREIDICERLEFYFDEFTPYDNVHSLKPGEYLLLDTSTGQSRRATWWQFPEYQGTMHDLRTALSEFLPLFEDACRIRKQADVPVTIFLSGGIDSALIQAVLRFDTTYTVQFDEFRDTIDEESLVLEYGRHLKFEPRFVRPTREEFFDCFPDLARFIEFPVGSFTVFPLYCLARQAHQDGFRVALSGEGADEFFNGYFRTEMMLREDALVGRYLDGPYQHLARRYFGSQLDRQVRMASRNGLDDVPVLQRFFAPRWRDDAPFAHNNAAIESTIFLQALLIMADRMSMASSLEVRNPFMDHRIVEFSAKLAPEIRYADGRGKPLLREALKTLLGVGGLGILRREVKHGLPSPVNRWLFKRNTFDRTDWNKMMLGECLRQMSLRGV